MTPRQKRRERQNIYLNQLKENGDTSGSEQPSEQSEGTA